MVATTRPHNEHNQEVSDVICYYDESKPVTVQCDASQSGLGAVLLQDGLPDCYASRALTPTESQYKQEIVTKI